MRWKGKGIIYGLASPRHTLFPFPFQPISPPCYCIGDTYTYAGCFNTGCFSMVAQNGGQLTTATPS